MSIISHTLNFFFIYASYIKDATLAGLDQVIYKLGIAFIPVHFSKENNANDKKIRAFFFLLLVCNSIFDEALKIPMAIVRI